MSIELKVNSWIQDAYSRGASDIHFEPDKDDKVRVRFRVDGKLKTIETAEGCRSVCSRLKVMAEMDLNEKNVPLDGRIRVDRWIKNLSTLDMRISTLPCLGGEKIVCRLIDRKKLGMTLDEIGFTPKMLARYRPLVSKPHGLILHVGPTGSGKTTSLYSIVQTLKKQGDLNIQTAEDPVEYDVFGITQSAVNPDQGLTFPLVLRALLRQDPDVILVGEIRDAETGTIAVEAAMTGHLVLSTLHTNDAVGTVVRLLDMGVPPFCIAYALSCVVSQRFVRRLCTKCRRSTAPNSAEARVLGSTRPIYKAKGCSECSREGYKGRIPLFEFLPSSPALRRAVYGNVTPDSLSATADANGLVTLFEDGRDKVWLGQTSLEEVMRLTQGKGAKKRSPGTGVGQSGVRPPKGRPTGGQPRRAPGRTAARPAAARPQGRPKPKR